MPGRHIEALAQLDSARQATLILLIDRAGALVPRRLLQSMLSAAGAARIERLRRDDGPCPRLGVGALRWCWVA